MKQLPYYHVDVFSKEPFAGNGLTVFTGTEGFSKSTMLQLTQEMRQFESIFLQDLTGNKVRAYIFTCEEELDFAGHPVLGAAGTLHDLYQPGEKRAEWIFELNKKSVQVITERKGPVYEAIMNQGQAEFGQVLKETESAMLLDCIGLSPEDLYPGCYPTVVSTGLPYLIIPLQKNGFTARVRVPDLEERILPFGAKFIGILEIPSLCIRSGNNKGTSEDIATGSLAGPVGAWLVKHGFHDADTLIQLSQGTNLGRASHLFVEVKDKEGRPGDVFVGGSVCKVSQNLLSNELTEHLLRNRSL